MPTKTTTTLLCPPKLPASHSIPLSAPPANGETRLAQQSPPVLEPKRAGRETCGPPGCNFQISFTDLWPSKAVCAGILNKRRLLWENESTTNDKTDISSDHRCEGCAQDWNGKSTCLISIQPIWHINLQPWHLSLSLISRIFAQAHHSVLLCSSFLCLTAFGK